MFPAVARQARENAIERTYKCAGKEIRQKRGKEVKVLKNGGEGAGLG
jgi:hypothetical protein